MGDSFRKVRTGQPLQIPAQAYNGFVDAAIDYQARQQRQGRDPRDRFLQTGIVTLKNNSGADRNRFDILGIDGPLFTPDDNLDSFTGAILLKGVLPDAAEHFGNFAVLLEPLADGAIGRGVLSGVCPVRLFVEDPEDGFEFADVDDGEPARLLAQPSGSAFILWRDALNGAASGGGEVWAYVRLSNVADGLVGSTSISTSVSTSDEPSSAASSSSGGPDSGGSGASDSGASDSGASDSGDSGGGSGSGSGSGSTSGSGSGGGSGGSGSGSDSASSSSSGCASSEAIECRLPTWAAGIQNWQLDTSNVFAEDNVPTTTELLSDSFAQLKCRDYDFAVPAAAKILGIKVRVRGRKKPAGEDGLIGNSSCRLYNSAGTLVGDTLTPTPDDDVDTGTPWPESYTDYIYGGENELWGYAWTPGDINSPEFAVLFQVSQDDNREDDQAEVDVIEICVYWEVCV